MKIDLFDMSLSYGEIVGKYGNEDGLNGIRQLFKGYISGRSKIDEFKHVRPGLYRLLMEMKERENA